jgi:hypothetical protein
MAGTEVVCLDYCILVRMVFMSDEKTVGANGIDKKGKIWVILLGISILCMIIGSMIAKGTPAFLGKVEVEKI